MAWKRFFCKIVTGEGTLGSDRGGGIISERKDGAAFRSRFGIRGS